MLFPSHLFTFFSFSLSLSTIYFAYLKVRALRQPQELLGLFVLWGLEFAEHEAIRGRHHALLFRRRHGLRVRIQRKLLPSCPAQYLRTHAARKEFCRIPRALLKN